MIIGIGNDLVAVERVAKACEKEGFLKISIALPGNEGAALVCRAALKPSMTVSAFVLFFFANTRIS